MCNNDTARGRQNARRRFNKCKSLGLAAKHENPGVQNVVRARSVGKLVVIGDCKMVAMTVNRGKVVHGSVSVEVCSASRDRLPHDIRIVTGVTAVLGGAEPDSANDWRLVNRRGAQDVAFTAIRTSCRVYESWVHGPFPAQNGVLREQPPSVVSGCRAFSLVRKARRYSTHRLL